jgi:hypothetical protein
VKTSSYPCNTSSDVFSTKHVFAPGPNLSRAIRHGGKPRGERNASTLIESPFFPPVACVNDRLWCNLSGRSSPHFLLQPTASAPLYPDVINLIISILDLSILFVLLHCQLSSSLHITIIHYRYSSLSFSVFSFWHCSLLLFRKKGHSNRGLKFARLYEVIGKYHI